MSASSQQVDERSERTVPMQADVVAGFEHQRPPLSARFLRIEVFASLQLLCVEFEDRFGEFLQTRAMSNFKLQR